MADQDNKKKGVKVLEQAPVLNPSNISTITDTYDAGASQIAGSAEQTAQAQERITAQQAAQMQANLDAMTAANAQADAAAQSSYNDFDTILQNMEQSRQAELERQRAANNKANQQDYNARVAGGLGEAAAALVNLIGAANGGTPAQWTSPQQEWAQRADAYRREREARFDNLRAQLENLAMQRAQIRYQFDQGRAQQMRSDAANAMGASNTIAQMQSSGQMQAAGTRQQGSQAAVNAALQGVNAGVSQFNTNRAYGLSAGQYQMALRNQNTKDYFQGYVDKDGFHPSQATDEERKAYVSTNSTSRSSSSTTDNTRNLRTADGQYVSVQMTDAEYKKQFDQVRREIEDEIENTKGKNYADNHRGMKESDVRNEVEAEMTRRMQAAQASRTSQPGNNTQSSSDKNWWE